MKIQIKPFIVPNFVLMCDQQPMPQSVSFPLSNLDPEELSAMCDDFRAAVFAKAGKRDPKAKP